MQLRWTSHALDDLERLYEFLEPANPRAAARAVQALVAAPTRFLKHPRIGERLDEFGPREVRRIVVGPYEIRYEIQCATITVLRLLHGREDR
jgi:plasmid stabilization system protein ParE